jgi:hypothetical protein
MSVPEGSSVSAVQTTDAATTAKNPLAPALRDYLKVDNATGLNNYTTTTGQVYNQNNTNGDSAAWSSYYFKQWTKDGTTYDLTTPVTEDITLTADYTTAMYVVFHGVNPTDPDNRDADLFTYKTFIQLNGTANLLGGQWKIGDTLTDIITAWNNTDYVKYFGYTAASAPPNDGTDYSEYYLEEWTRDLTTVFSAPFDLTRTPVTADMLDGTGTLHLYTRWAKEEADEFNLIFLLENAAWDNGSKMPKVVQLKKEGTDTDLTNLDLSAITDDIVLADANYDVTNGTVTYCVPAPQDYTFPTGNTVNGQPEMLTLSAATVGNTAVGVDQLPSYSTQNWSTPATIAQVKANTPKIPNIVDTVFIKFSALPQVVYQNAASGGPANITNSLPAAQAYTSGATVNVAADLTTDSVSNTAGQKGVWTFNGWSDGTTTYKAGETFTMPATPVTLTASWTFTAYKDYQVTYQVTADANYGVPDARADLKDTYLETAEVTVRAPLTSTVGAATKDGQRVFGTWSFSAWTLTGNTDGVTIRNNTFTMPGHDVTFTGAWSFTPTPTHKVTYEVTGADKPTYTPDSIAETDRAEGQTVTVAAAPTTAWNTQTGTDDGGTEGYWSFSGWKTTDVANYKVGDGTFTMPTKDVKFTGSWTFVAAPRYNLKYVITDEAGTDLTPYLTNPDLFAPTTYGKGQTVSISYPVLNRNTKTGRDDSGAAGIWTFSGWTITKDTDNSEINPTNYQFEMPDDHVTLTGKFIFTPTYTVTYSVTGDKPGDMNPGSFPTNVYVTGNTVTVAGYPTTAWNTQTGKDDSGDAGTWTFSGWADGGTTYKEGDTFAMPDRNVVLTGSWTFQKTGGGTPPATTSDPAPTSSTGVDKVLNTSEHVAFLLGYQDGSFRPDNDMTRAEAAMMFYRLLLDKETDAEQQFPDVPQDAWYAEAVRVLTANNIIYGYQDGYYRPEYPITRAQFTAIAMRFAFPPTEGESVYSDVEPDDWFYADVVGATQYGWISGYGDGTFRPDDTISRAEVAAIMNRMLGRQADESFAEHFREHLRQFNDLPLDYWAYHHIVEASNPHTYQSLWEKIDERLTDRMEKIENWLNLKK